MTTQTYFLECWNRELPATLACIRAIPSEKADYRPHPKNRSTRELVHHFVPHVDDLIEAIQEGVINHRNSVPYASFEEAAQEFEAKSAQLSQLVSQIDEKTWNERVVTLKVFGYDFGSYPLRDQCYRFLFDIIHHRGQLSMGYRPMGVVTPVIYGATTETTEAFLKQVSIA